MQDFFGNYNTLQLFQLQLYISDRHSIVLLNADLISVNSCNNCGIIDKRSVFLEIFLQGLPKNFLILQT